MKKAESKCCPHCRKPVADKDNPDRLFCSDRCRLIDLGSWSLERYRITGRRIEGESEDDDVTVSRREN